MLSLVKANGGNTVGANNLSLENPLKVHHLNFFSISFPNQPKSSLFPLFIHTLADLFLFLVE
ncbi:hypothetical protein IEQ34_014015 [Dendrobium chrysotoxum]|uniref:Uncharacterized protein n=1 Tax=Dendrobium chrysotoxum TaxID=161865 RepID=A0AAV7GKW3_DENCH|nr:hypothetical protein IEQ34_014015 [Dendrobium chrysotoxum]